MAVNPAASNMYIVNPPGGDALQSLAALLRTHPLTEERIARLEEMAAQRRNVRRSPRLGRAWGAFS